MLSIYAIVAKAIGVATEEVIEIRNWSNTLWVRVRRYGSRFVSKKVLLGVKAKRREKVALCPHRFALIKAMMTSAGGVNVNSRRLGNDWVLFDIRDRIDKETLLKNLNGAGFESRIQCGVLTVALAGLVRR